MWHPPARHALVGARYIHLHSQCPSTFQTAAAWAASSSKATGRMPQHTQSTITKASRRLLAAKEGAARTATHKSGCPVGHKIPLPDHPHGGSQGLAGRRGRTSTCRLLTLPCTPARPAWQHQTGSVPCGQPRPLLCRCRPRLLHAHAGSRPPQHCTASPPRSSTQTQAAHPCAGAPSLMNC